LKQGVPKGNANIQPPGIFTKYSSLFF